MAICTRTHLFHIFYLWLLFSCCFVSSYFVVNVLGSVFSSVILLELYSKFCSSQFITRASEQGNVIGFACIYIYIYVRVSTKKIVIERTRDLIYLKFVATDFFPKIISPSTGENSSDSV